MPLLLVLLVALPLWAQSPPASIAIHSEVAKGGPQAEHFSRYIAGYLDNIKNNRVDNLDRHIRSDQSDSEFWLQQAADRGAEALLLIEVEGFTRQRLVGRLRLRLLKVADGAELDQWRAPIEPPYIESNYAHSRPYGNLDQVFAHWPVQQYPVAVERNVLLVSDQRLRARGGATRSYLEQQLAMSSRVLEREFGLRLNLQGIQRWRPPDIALDGIAKAAALIPERAAADLTLVCLGAPSPDGVVERSRAVGYARVLTNVVVTSQLNAHVFVHEIGHVLGAIHVDDEGAIMQPYVARHRLFERFPVRPPIAFSPSNRKIIAHTFDLPLGTTYEQHRDKIAGLLAIYRDLQTSHLPQVAPYYADVLLQQGQLDQALELLHSALEEAPNDYHIRLRLLYALRQAGRHEEAHRLLQQDFAARQRFSDPNSLRPTIRLSTTGIAFNHAVSGRTYTHTLTVSNWGTAPLAISRIDPPAAPFALDPDTPLQIRLEPGAFANLEISFKPVAKGFYNSTLEIACNVPGKARVTVQLSGRVGE